MPESTKPKRRWFQFRLRTLLVVMLLCAVVLGLYARARLQRLAVISLWKESAYVRYDFQFPKGSYRNPADFDPFAVSPVPRWLLYLLGVDFFHSVVEVDVRRSNGHGKRNPDAENALLRRLRAFPKLRRLKLRHCGVTDQGLRHLAGFTSLEMLDLSYSSVTDDGMPYIGELKSLKRLDLAHTRVGGRGFHRLTPLEHLETVFLTYAPVGDEGLNTLTAIPGLKYISVHGCRRLTPDGVAAFQQALPKCELGGLYHLKSIWQHSVPRPRSGGHPVDSGQASVEP